MKECILWLYRASKGCRLKLVCRAMMGVAHVMVSLAFIMLSKRLVDMATGHTEGDMKVCVTLWISCVLLQLLLSVVESRLDIHTVVDMGNRMRNGIFRHVMESRWRGRESIHTGDVMNRMEGDIDTVTSLICQTVPSVVISATQLMLAALFLGVLDMRLAVAIVVITPVALLLSKSYMKRMRRMTHAIREEESRLQVFIQEHLQNRMLVVTLEYTAKALKRMDGLLQEIKRQVFRRTDYSLFSRTVVQGGFSLGYVTAFLWGVNGLNEGTITFGMMTAFLQLVAQIQRPVLEMGRQVPAFVHAMASADRLMELERLPQEEKGESVRLSGRIGVRMENVCFAYTEDGRKVFSDFSHDFRPGSLTAVVGETGVGKSTLIRMLLALVSPEMGSIRFYTDKEEVIASPQTRCNIVYVPQGNSLMSGTIRENLLLGNPQASEAQMREALHTAAAEFVYDLPEGLDTSCGEKGAGLSDGQAQRIAIARGLLRSGGVLLLDEPTSSVDGGTETILLERLATEVRDKTLILVTHRDKIAELCSSKLHLKRV